MAISNVDGGADPYWTLATPAEYETVVERSRFIAHALPIRTLDKGQERVSELRRQHHDARHVCFGLRIGRGAQGLDRSNDDGEPSRTGGYPLWQLLDGAEITDAIIIVVRYFGGVKLGMGGLARAYRDAGRQAMELAKPEQRWPEVRRRLTIPYPQHDRVVHLLGQLDGVRIENTEYGVEPTLVLAVRKLAIEEVRTRLGGLLQTAPESLLTA